jgi:hypothetical protein
MPSVFGDPPVYPTRPFLAYTRKRGWIVATTISPELRKLKYIVAGSRPGSVELSDRDILAIADLPPPPPEAV